MNYNSTTNHYHKIIAKLDSGSLGGGVFFVFFIALFAMLSDNH